MDDNEQKQINWEDAAVSASSANETMALFLSAANVSAVYGEPIEHGENLIIPAAEILSFSGFGSGYGGSNEPKDQAGGGGGGGGGRIFSRPVAVIVAGTKGVEVQPVFDITKVALAGITAFGFMLATLARMRRRKLKV
jgi:uncharacterized spore protein YtfJ